MADDDDATGTSPGGYDTEPQQKHQQQRQQQQSDDAAASVPASTAPKMASSERLLRWAMDRCGDADREQCLSAQHIGHGAQLMEDRRTVSQSFSNTGEGDLVQAEWPITLRCGVGYFEVRMCHVRRQGGLVGVGLGHAGCSTGKGPHRKTLLAYRSDTGRKYTHHPQDSASYGPRFATNDTIGCGVVMRTSTVFFTRNGVHLGNAFTLPRAALEDYLHPTAVVEHATITFDFDGRAANGGFKWDPSALMDEERRQYIAAAEESEAYAPCPDVSDRLVAAYLIHHGYERSATALLRAASSRSAGAACTGRAVAVPSLMRRDDANNTDTRSNEATPPAATNGDADSNGNGAAASGDSLAAADVRDSRMAVRRAVVAAIERGDVAAATETVRRELPGVMDEASPLLLSQAIIEAVNVGDIESALATTASPGCGGGVGGEAHPVVGEAIGLLAYASPHTSPLAHLFDPAQRRRVATSVNALMLSHLGFPTEASLDTLLKHALMLPVLAKAVQHPLSLSDTDG